MKKKIKKICLSIALSIEKISFLQLLTVCIILLAYIVYLNNQIDSLMLELVQVEALNLELNNKLNYYLEITETKKSPAKSFNIVSLMLGLAVFVVGGLGCVYFCCNGGNTSTTLASVTEKLIHNFTDANGVDYTFVLFQDGSAKLLVLISKESVEIGCIMTKLAISGSNGDLARVSLEIYDIIMNNDIWH